jgi:hypothetical protein
VAVGEFISLACFAHTMTRTEIHQLFVSEFHQGEPPVPVTAPDIQRVERELATILPQSYITFMQTHGSVSASAV